MSEQRVLITGHKGFIGRHVYADFIDSHGDANVMGIDLPDNIGDFTMGNYDLVIHLAAFADIRESLDNPRKYYENNVLKAKPLFDWCAKTDTRLVYASSSAVLCKYWENPYAMSKWINEQMAPPNSVGLRLTTVYSEMNSRPDMLYRRLENKTATYLTNHKRDWIHVEDVCRAIRYLADSNIRGPISVGTGESVKVIDLAHKMGMAHLPLKEHTPGEAQDNKADISLLLTTGWYPTHSVL